VLALYQREFTNNEEIVKTIKKHHKRKKEEIAIASLAKFSY